MNINSIVFDIGDTVYMVMDDEIRGVITGILLTDGGCEYRVTRFNDSEKIQDWLYACEIKK